jgi:hypothetical protein
MGQTWVDKYELVGGPQDGARICRTGYPLPLTVYVGPKWMGDGFAAWSDEPSERFPAKYVNDGGGQFLFAGMKGK